MKKNTPFKPNFTLGKNFKVKLVQILCYSVFLFLIFPAKCQTTTIDYLKTSVATQLLQQNPCNVFTTNQTIGGVAHQSWAGGVDYTSGKGIFLPTTFSTTIGYSGSAYLLLYNFNPGTFYTIAITTSGGDGYIQLGTSTSKDGASVPVNFPTSNSNTCGVDTKVSNYTIRGYAEYQSPVAAAITTTTLGTFSPTDLQQYLVIWANGVDPRVNADGFYISKIIITAATPSFSISPASINLSCGNAISQTFTALNNNQTPGVVSYTWHLGTVPNNWYFNGSPAPATVTTSANNILLTIPGCSTLPSSGSQLYVTANYPPFATSSGNVAVSTPAISINGPTSMCGQPTIYNISNLNCPSAIVNWSASPAGNVSFSCTTCSQTTISKIVSGSSITLSANLTGACSSSPINLSKPVDVDAPNNLTGTYSTSTQTYPLNTVNFVRGGVISGQYNWYPITNQSLTPSGTASWSYGGNGTFGFYITTGQNMNLNFSGTSATCGTVTATRTFLQSSFGNLVVTASPVPSNGTLTVTLDQVPDTTITFEKAQTLSSVTFNKKTKISIFDVNAGNLIKQWDYQENEKASYNLNISGIKAGIYILKVERNNRMSNSKIMIQ